LKAEIFSFVFIKSENISNLHFFGMLREMEVNMKNCKNSNYKWIVLASYMFIGALTQLFWVNFASIDTYAEKLLNVSAMKIGFLTMVFPLTFLILSIPAGIVIDRKGYKFSIMLGAAFTAFFALIRVLFPFSYSMLLISQTGISIGQPFVLNSITKLAGLCFPDNEEATVVGLGSLSLFIGMIIGMGITPLLTNHYGFTSMLAIYAALSVCGIAFLYITNRRITEIIENTESSIAQYISNIKNIVSMKSMIILGAISFIAIGSFNGILTWLEKILSEMHHIPMAKSGTIATLLIFSGMVGCFIIPELSDRTKRRAPFLTLGLSVAAISLLIFALINGNTVKDTIILIVMGFFAISVFPLMLTMSAEITGKEFAGFSASFIQLLGNGAAVVIVPFINLLPEVTNCP